MKQWKKWLGIFMADAVLITGGVLPQKNAATAEGATDYGISKPRVENGVTTWDKIKFGSYYQDAEVQPAESIKWRVLSVDGDDAFLLADEILDAKPYNERYEYVTWETCTLRKWLNEDFYNEAFDAEEKKAVMETTVVNENNPNYDTEGGNDTKDKVYLLSIAETGNAEYGFDTEFNKHSKTRKAKNSDYAKLNNVWSSSNGFGDWWLRSPGYYSNSAAIVYDDGYGTYDGDFVAYGNYGVRPALHINLSSSKVEDAGEVNSEGNITMLDNGISNPVVKDGVTTWDCVYFGNYRQDFSVKQDIEWRVLSVDGDDAFLLADRNLDCRRYNEEWEDVTWETCTLRKWLNEDFYNEVFDTDEKKAVMETTVINANNPYYYTEGGNDTKDKVYLLSIAEASDAAYGFDTEFNEESKTREAKNTDYVKVNNVYSSSIGYWWLRSPGDDSRDAASVRYDGCGDDCGNDVINGYGVRPALHINLSSTSSWSYAGTVTSEGVEINYGSPTSSECRIMPSFSTYTNKLSSFYFQQPFFQQNLLAALTLKSTTFAIPGLSTTNLIEDTGTGPHYLNNDTYVPQGICRMDDYILISAYQESYKGWKKTKDGKWVQDWRAEHNSVIYVLDGRNFEYLATLVLPYTYHNGGIAFDGSNVWLTNSSGKKEGDKQVDKEDDKEYYYVYYIKKDIIKSKTAEIRKNGPYSAMIHKEEIGESYSVQNKPSCLTWYDGRLWVGTNGGIGKICGYMVTGRDTEKPVLESHKCETISSSSIPGMKSALAKCINGIEFDGGDLYLSVSSGRQGAVKHIIRAKKIGSGYTASSYRVAKEVLVPDMSEELMIEGGTLYCVFESGANHYNGNYGKGPNIVTERVLAFDKALWED